MPEGHTIHRIARDHQRWFADQRLGAVSPQGRFKEEACRLSGKKLKSVSAHGKHLFYHWTGDRIVHVHLGLYGKFRIHKNPAPDPRGAVRLRMIGNERTFDLNGPNRCQLIDRKQHRAVLTRLGEDPLQSNADPEIVWDRIGRSGAPIGTLLLNQSIISGIGNVYRAEILFLLGIDPLKPGNEISPATFEELWQLAVELLSIGVKYNRIITVKRQTTGKALSRLTSGERLNIYKKQKCPDCSSPVSSWELGNRTMYSCTKCQK